jgi:hypothetical protein
MKRPSEGLRTWVWTIVSGLVFLLVLGVRQHWFGGAVSVTTSGAIAQLRQLDTWYCVTQDHQPIGHVHRTLEATDTGYSSEETMRIRINTMGVVQEVSSRLSARLNPDLSIADMALFLGSGVFRFQASATVLENGKLLFRSGTGEQTLDLNGPLYLPGLCLLAELRDRPPSMEVFEPFSLSRHRIRIISETDEPVEIMGKSIDARRFDVEFMGLRQSAWIDATGQIVKELSGMGLSLEQCEMQTALAGISGAPGADLTAQASIAADKTIPSPAYLTLLRVRFSGPSELLRLEGGRQSFSDGVLSIRKESVAASCTGMPENGEPYLRPSLLVQSGSPEIQSLAKTFLQSLPPNPAGALRVGTPHLVRKILGWMEKNIEKRPVLSVPNALDTLKNRAGDCNEHAALFAALARACGIPTRIETGLVYLRGRFYYHAWNAVFCNDWITVDASMGQFPADVTHIRLALDEDQTALVAAIGNIGLSIQEMQP